MASVSHIVAMPYPGRGHINPMMDVCELLASRGLRVTVVLTEEWLGLLSSYAAPPNLRLHSIPNVIPSEHGRGADFSGFFEAVSTKMAAPFEELLDSLESPVAGIIADTYLAWVVAVGNRRKVKVFSLWTPAASVFTVFYHFHLLTPGDYLPADLLLDRGDQCIDCIPGIKSLRTADLTSCCFSRTVMPIILNAFSWVKKAECLLLTAFYELEPELVETLKEELPFPLYPVGPSIPYMTLQAKPAKSITVDHDTAYYYTWLDSQPRGSVLYVSFGSFLPISGPQLDEIASGLRASRVRYMWITRANLAKVQVMSDNSGLVVPWCEQLKVLCHPSVGGFFTHCGWNSTLEGVYAGLPFLAFPLSLDQFANSKLIVDEWKIGVRLREQRAEESLVRREDITKWVKALMDLDGDGSREIRERAKNLQVACHRALEDGGSSFDNLSTFIRHMTGLSN